jgi:DNA-binding protein HU-beta
LARTAKLRRNGSEESKNEREKNSQIRELSIFRGFFAFSLALRRDSLYSVARARPRFGPPQKARIIWNAGGGKKIEMAKPMSKSKVVGFLADKLETPRKTVNSFFEELFKLAVKECKGSAGKFVIPNLGRAVKAHRKARMGRNPQTGEAIKIKAKTVVRLRPAKAFKDAVLG